MKQISALITCSLLFFSNPTFAGFDFCQGNSGEEGGSDTFQQQIPLNGVVKIGELPSGISGVEISLTSPVDIDIQLYDKETGDKLVHWPSGALSGSGQQSFVYHGTLIEWSGYNGDGTGSGNEYIKISNSDDPSAPTSRAFIMKAFGYKAGLADVNYSWGGASCDTASGNGSFQQQIVQDAIVNVGDIPVGISNLNIKLKSPVDVDVQLYDKDNGKAIVAWPSGLLNGSTTQSISYQGMEIEWSGYNGDGSGAGNEYIKISGETTRNLTMEAFGYRSGEATVNYSWGGSDSGNGGNSGGDSPTGEEATVKSQILSLVNQARSQGRNCGSTFYPATTPLTWNSKLYQAALGHSKDMATNNFFSHTGSDGNNAASRITAAGYSWFTYGENISAGYFSAQSAIDGWLASSGHCKNIMNPSVTNVAAAKATGGSYGIYWTQVFARGQ
jgi:uncharacterized protein YkwD